MKFNVLRSHRAPRRKMAGGLAVLLVTAALAAQTTSQGEQGTAAHSERTPYHKFLGPWRVIGPIDPGKSDQKERMATPYLDLEKDAALPDSVTTGGQTLAAVTIDLGLVNLGLAFDREEEFKNAVAYAETIILSPDQREAVLTIGGDDGVIAWINGEKVIEHVRPNGVYLDDKTATVTLKSGMNRVLVKCDNISEDWGFAARLLPVDQAHSIRLLYHLKPLPVALGHVPDADMEFLNGEGEVIDKQTVSAWKVRSSPTRAGYIAYPQVDEQPARVRVTMAVPGTDKRFEKTLNWDDATDQSIGEPGALSVSGKVVDSETSQPLANATLSLNNMATSQVVTDDKGQFAMAGVEPAHGRIYVNAAGHIEGIAQVDVRRNEPITIELEKGGVELAGTIKDEDGKPVEGATVRFTAGGRQRMATSGKDGKYSVSGIKATSKAGMTVYPVISHPEYQPLASFSEKIAAEGTTSKDYVLKRGFTVFGSVTDPEGKPVRNATVTSGDDDFASNSGNPKTETDAEGGFRLGGLKPGVANVFAFHSDWAPAIKNLTLAGTTETEVNFTLEPGKSVTGRIVDPEGKGISGATIATDTWRNTRMFRHRATADEDGNFELKHMPADAVKSDAFQSGYSSVRGVELKGGDTNVSITLPLPARISGVVVDAVTGDPVTSFTLTKGYEWKSSNSSPYWSDSTNLSPSDGKFSLTETELSNYNRLLRIDAPGYKTWEHPKSIAAGEQVQDIVARLEKAQLRPAIVTGPDGKPVADAKVHLFGTGRTLWIGSNASQSKAKVFTTDANGKVGLPDDLSEEDGLYIEKEGVGAVLIESVDTKAEPLKLRLEPYGVVTGAVFEGDTALSGQELVLLRGSSQKLQVHYESTADEAGRFKFENVPVGEYSLAVRREFGNTSTYDRQKKIDVGPGENAPELIGGTGGTRVYGRMTSEEGAPLPGLSVRLYDNSGQSFSTYTDGNGDFEITEVPQGEMTLSAQTLVFRSTDQERYSGSEQLTIPEAAELEKDLTLIARKPLVPGSRLKGLQGVDHAGTTVSLSDQRNDKVLLILPSRMDKPKYEELLKSFTQAAESMPSKDVAILAVLVGGPEDKSLGEFSTRFPLIKFLSPSSEWTSDFYKRHNLANDIVGAIVKPDGEVISLVKDAADVKQLSGEVSQ